MNKKKPIVSITLNFLFNKDIISLLCEETREKTVLYSKEPKVRYIRYNAIDRPKSPMRFTVIALMADLLA
jgi:hypothetical protein